jgi:hypothetical protein
VRSLKKILFQAYGGFADKRIKDLDKSDRFIVDDRDDPDLGAGRKPLSSFCMMFAEVRSNVGVKVILFGNIPLGKDVERWLTKHNCEIRTSAHQSMLSINVERGSKDILSELADAIEQIVVLGKPHYKDKSYKLVCTRTAKSLRRLNAILDDAWPSTPEGMAILKCHDL